MYPIQSLAIIAPIIFILFIIAMPVIGVFAGWKRAAYWGGGTFLFFLIGLIIWKTAGSSISNSFVSMISGMLPEGSKIQVQLVRSIVAPVFFLIVMAIAELILLINYYAWFKRVSKIKQDVAAKKQIKAAKKAGKKVTKDMIPSSTWGQMQFTTKGKIINMVAGGAGLGLLMAPSTITFTQGIYYLTTNSATREESGFAQGMYSLLQNTSGAFSWMSYYNGKEAGIDCDSLMTSVHMLTTNVDSYKTVDPNTGELIEKTGQTKNAIDVMVDVMQNGFTSVINFSVSKEGTATERVEKIETSIENFASAWNTLEARASTAMNTLFQSEAMTSTIQSIIEQQTKSSVKKLGNEDIQTAFGVGSAFVQVYADYVAEQVTNLVAITVTQEVFDTLVATIENLIQPADDVTEENKTLFHDHMQDIVAMMFKVA